MPSQPGGDDGAGAAPPPPPPPPSWHVTPLAASTAALGTLAASAFAGGAAHWASTAKALAEEGIDTLARVRALPTAVSWKERRELSDAGESANLATSPHHPSLSSTPQAKALAHATVAIGGSTAAALSAAQVVGLVDLGAAAAGGSAELSPAGAAEAAESLRAAVRGMARRRILGEDEG